MENESKLLKSFKESEPNKVEMVLNLLQIDSGTINTVLWLFHDQFNEAYAAIDGDGSQILNLDSSAFQQWLFNFVYEQTTATIGDNTIKSVVKILRQKAKQSYYPLSVRVGGGKEHILYDLGTSLFVSIKPEGWELQHPITHIVFRRYAHQKPQATPTREGNMNDLLKLINVADLKDEILLKVYLVTAFIPNFPHPVLVVQGPQGSAKSTLCRFLKDLIDPSSLETDSLHGDKGIDRLIQTSSHHWLLVLDNLSSLSNEASDIISRICTGGGLSKRKLYSNDDDFIYNFRHLIALNGITQVVFKPDLLDRSIIVQLDRITDSFRKTEGEVWEEFGRLKAGILGSIFDTVGKAMKEFNSIKLEKLPRMADFVKWGCAVAVALGYSQEQFIAAYEENTANQIEAAVDANPIATAIVEFMERRGDNIYMDTPTNFYQALSNVAKDLSLDKSLGWPNAANSLSKKIPEFMPVLQSLGLKVSISKGKSRSVTILRVRKDGSDDISITSSLVDNPIITDTADGNDGSDDTISF